MTEKIVYVYFNESTPFEDKIDQGFKRKMAAYFYPLARAGNVPFPRPFCSCSA